MDMIKIAAEKYARELANVTGSFRLVRIEAFEAGTKFALELNNPPPAYAEVDPTATTAEAEELKRINGRLDDILQAVRLASHPVYVVGWDTASGPDQTVVSIMRREAEETERPVQDLDQAATAYYDGLDDYVVRMPCDWLRDAFKAGAAWKGGQDMQDKPAEPDCEAAYSDESPSLRDVLNAIADVRSMAAEAGLNFMFTVTTE